jgi:hypothetical protein
MTMYLKIPDAELIRQLQVLLSANFYPGATSFNVDLYTSNIIPSNTDTWATYSAALASFPGYATVNLTSSAWGTITVTGSVASVNTTSNLVYTLSSTLGSPVIVYGYVVSVVVSAVTYLLFAQLFDSPLVYQNAGDSYNFPLNFTLQNAH